MITLLDLAYGNRHRGAEQMIIISVFFLSIKNHRTMGNGVREKDTMSRQNFLLLMSR